MSNVLDPTRLKDKDLYEQWRRTDDERKVLVNNERILREEVVKRFGKNRLKEGMNNVLLPNGVKLKMEIKNTYKLDKNETKSVVAGMVKAKLIEPVIAERLVKYEPSLSIREYRLLSDEARKELDKVLTITPGAPSVKVDD